MINLIGLILTMFCVVGLLFALVVKNTENLNTKSVQQKQIGYFDYISKKSFNNYDKYTLYTKKDDGIEEQNFVVFNEIAIEGVFIFDIKTNQLKNSYNFDFYKNSWGDYDKKYNNKIIIHLDENTKIKDLNKKQI